MLTIRKREGDEIAETYFVVGELGKEYFSLGISLPGFLSEDVYCVLRPEPDMAKAPKGFWKKAKLELARHFHGYRLLAEIYKDKPENIRFAQFFGFKHMRTVGDRALYARYG